jgi:hypothetical protein
MCHILNFEIWRNKMKNPINLVRDFVLIWLIKRHINNYNYNEAVLIIEKLPEPSRTEWLIKILQIYFRIGNFDKITVISIAEKLSEPSRTEWLSKILEECIRWGTLEQSNLVLKKLGREFTLGELVQVSIKIVGFYCFDEIVSILERLPEPSRTEWRVAIIKIPVRDCYFNRRKAISIIEKLPEPYRTEWLLEILRVCLEFGEFEEVDLITQYLGYELASKEFSEKLELSIAFGLEESSALIAQRLGRNLTAEELSRISEQDKKLKAFRRYRQLR